MASLIHVLPLANLEVAEPEGYHSFRVSLWEVLDGVGVHGVGGIFPIFFVFLRSSSFFFLLLLILLGQGQITAIYLRIGNFTPTPSAPTPFRTSRSLLAWPCLWILVVTWKVSGWPMAGPKTGTVFPGTEGGTGTAGTVFQELKPEPKPSLSVKLCSKTEIPLPQRDR